MTVAVWGLVLMGSAAWLFLGPCLSVRHFGPQLSVSLSPSSLPQALLESFCGLSVDPSQEIALYLFPCAKGNLPDPDRMLLVTQGETSSLDPSQAHAYSISLLGALESLRVVEQGSWAAPCLLQAKGIQEC